MIKVKYIIICILISCICSDAYSLSPDSAFVRKLIKDLSSPQMYGRGYSYNGDSIAAEYIRQQLEDIGVEPLCDNYFQSYGFYVNAIEGELLLQLDDKELDPFKDYSVAPFSSSLEEELRLIVLPPKAMYDDKAFGSFIKKYRKQLNSSIVYIDTRQYTGEDQHIKDTVTARLRRMNNHNPFNNKAILLGVEKFPVRSMNKTDIQRDYSLLYVDHNLVDKSIKKVRVKITSRHHYHQTQNVCGMIKGVEQPDSLIVLTAHYDHIGMMGDQVMYPGAHDNASGTAAVLDFAKYFVEHRPKYSVAFILVSGEEVGLKGSTHFVQHPLIQLDKIKLLLNIDLFCGGDDGITLVNSESATTRPYFDKFVMYNDKYQYIKTVKPRNNAPNSDHYPFSQYCPAMFLYTMGGRSGGYHNYTDTCENCGLENYNSLFNLILKVIDF